MKTSDETRPFADSAKRLSDNGLSTVPLRQNTKAPFIKEWQKYSQECPTEKQIDNWIEKFPESNIGLVCGPASGIVAVDIDTEDKDICRIIDELLPPSPVRKRGKKGETRFYRYNGHSNRKIKKHPNSIPLVEILAENCQTVMPPSIHPETLRPYIYLTEDTLEDTQFTDLPELPFKAIDHLETRLNALEIDERDHTPGGRNNNLKAQVTAAIYKGKSDNEIATEIYEFDLRTHRPPLFSDPNEYRMKWESPKENALKFTTSIRSSIYGKLETYTTTSVKSEKNWPKALAEAAFYGLAGDIIKKIIPHTESDPAALLFQFLALFGNVVGRNAYYSVERAKHFLNLYVCIVGKTSKGRKGTALNNILFLFEQIEQSWRKNCFQSGLSSGEGLIWAVRDSVKEEDGNEESTNDPGASDKRLMVTQSEFGATLRILRREGNTLSAIMRDAWDDGNLGSLTKNSPAKSTNAHISLIGHITTTELLRYLSETESANGFGNRILWVCAKRSKLLPDGGNLHLEDLGPLVERLKHAIEFGHACEQLKRDKEASVLWHRIYSVLSREVPGMLGAMTSRAEAQVVRISSIYAILDQSNIITEKHLSAAIAVWEYSEASCRYIFGDSTGTSIADEILRALRNSKSGLTRTEIRDLLGRNKRKSEIAPALELLEESNLAHKSEIEGKGRKVEKWVAVDL